MQRTFLNAGSRSCGLANSSTPSRCTSDLTPRVISRSFGNVKRKIKPQTATLLRPKARERRLAEVGEKALAAKYKRNQYNKDYRERRRDQAEAKKEKEDDSRIYDVAGVYRRAMRQPAKDSFKAMKEDWALGPLAPKRDVGDQAGKMGTVEMGLHQLHHLTKTQREDVKARMGDNVFKPHDRVVVLSGRDRGKIGNILSIDEEKMSATIEGINKVAVHVPEYMARHDSDTRSFRVMRRDVRLDELKLVLPIRDPQTNELKDVILDRMDLKEVLVHAPGKCAEIKPSHGDEDLVTDEGVTFERESKDTYEIEDFKWKTLRYVPGTDTEILDHSENEDKHDWEKEYGPNDTLALAVDEQTYWPEITRDPMTASVVREVTFRGRKEVTKFSDYIEEAIKERAETKLRKQFELEDRIRTPLQELKLELKKVQQKARKERLAEFNGRARSKPQAGKKANSTLVAYDEDGELDEALPKKPERVSNIMVTIGQAMARSWAQNPSVVTGERKQLLQKVLEQERAVPKTSSEARV